MFLALIIAVALVTFVTLANLYVRRVSPWLRQWGAGPRRGLLSPAGRRTDPARAR